MRILVVEDDASLRRGISYRLEKEGYAVTAAKDAGEARWAMGELSFDLAILDVGLPDGDGFSLCAQLRAVSGAHIVFLTAKDEEHNVLAGYDAGADDYMTKPFGMMVLLSKVQAIANRRGAQVSGVRCGALLWDAAGMTLHKDGAEVPLSRNEMKLLARLMDHPGQVLTHEALLSALWDVDGQFVDANTVAVNVRRLREKIEDDPSRPQYVQTVRGVGYRWAKECQRL